MILNFENSEGKEEFVAIVRNEDEAFLKILNFLEDKHYESHYTRRWTAEDGHMVYDFGSHTEFFHLYKRRNFFLKYE